MNENLIVLVLAAVAGVAILSFVAFTIVRAVRDRAEAKVLVGIILVMGIMFTSVYLFQKNRDTGEDGAPVGAIVLAVIAGAYVSTLATKRKSVNK